MELTIFSSAILFLIVTLLLVIILLVAKKYLVPSGNVTIDINDGKKTLEVPQGSSLLSTLASQKIHLASACGGKGSCGQCKLQVIDGGGNILPTEAVHFSRKEQQAHWRLGCQVKVKDNLLIHLKEKKTGKYRDVVLPSSVAKNIQAYLDISKLKYDAWLFPSDKSSGKMSMRTNGGISIGKNGNVYQHEAQPKKAGEPLDVDSFGRIMRRVQKDLNLPYKLGTHSCRKTFGYWFMKQNQDDSFALAWLMKMLNHSSQAMTLHYIGLTKDNENEFYNSVDYGV